MSIAVQCKGIKKRFGETRANDGVDLEVHFGEIHAIVGENGAGKSTLMKILAGLQAPDEGEVFLRGEKIQTFSPRASIEKGVGMVHQHFMLVESFTVTENVILGQEKREGIWLEQKKAAAQITSLAEKYGLSLNPQRKIEDLSVGEKQRVEIIKVLYRGAEIFIFDEPTAVLSPPEVKQFLETLRALASANKAILLITHKLDEVLAVASRITVMRQGRSVALLDAKETTPSEIAKAMVGREVKLASERKPHAEAPAKEAQKPSLVIERLTVLGPLGTPALRDFSLAVRAGEIVGVAGVEGNGQHELVLALCGLLPLVSGKLSLEGRDLTALSPRQRNKAGLAHVPEDRHRRGLVLEMSVAENLILGEEERFSSALGVLSQEKIQTNAQRLIQEFDIRPPNASLAARGLSGGNQQKIVIAREMTKSFSVLIASQPTRGVDVGAIEFIHERILAARANGKAILLLSAELEEVMSLSDRIIVLYRGSIAGEVLAKEASREQLGSWMAGVK